MDNQLPTEFDLIIVGTGLIESILSAAASRIGKTVLHIDSEKFYGGHWASYNLQDIQNICDKKELSAENININDFLQENETSERFGNDLFEIQHFKQYWHIPDKKEEAKVEADSFPVVNETTTKAPTEQIDNTDKPCELKPKVEFDLKESEPKFKQLTKADLPPRKFNIDLAPKLHYARGDMVELFISSNVARYSEFRSVSRVLTWLNGDLEIVPCSRSDVFANSKVSVIEKRMLMKLFTSLDSNEDELKAYDNKTFRTYLKDKKLSPSLIHYVLYAISMSTDETPCKEGVKNTKRFLSSLGRFGKTPFLFSMYGSGEIPQCFCRLSAVFGGVFALNQNIRDCIFEDNKFTGLICENQRISAKMIAMGIGKAPRKFIEKATSEFISRAVFITDKSIMDSENEHLTLLLYPPEGGKKACTIIELGTLVGTCPKDLFMVHLTARQTTNPEEDFKHCVENLLNMENNNESKFKPNVLWSCYFSIPDSNDLSASSAMPENVFLCPGPDLDLDYDKSIKKAHELFKQMYPDCEFLPRAPDPEEIIFEGEETKSDNTILTAEDKSTNTEQLNFDEKNIAEVEPILKELPEGGKGDEEVESSL